VNYFNGVFQYNFLSTVIRQNDALGILSVGNGIGP